MLLSRASEYGMQALVILNAQQDGAFVSVERIAQSQGISHTFLSKVLGQLVAHGLLISQKGPGGGVRLARPAKRIRLLEVVEAIDGLELFRQCVIGYPNCGDNVPCPLHRTWGPIRTRLAEMLSRQSLDNVMRGMKSASSPHRPAKRAVRRRKGGSK